MFEQIRHDHPKQVSTFYPYPWCPLVVKQINLDTKEREFMADQTVIKNSPEMLADNLFSLTDPWKGRFLAFVAQRAMGQSWNGQLPSEQEVTNWLNKEGLYQAVTLMLQSWHGEIPLSDGG
jgi:hypothetical protein